MTSAAQSLLQEIGTLPPERFSVIDGALFADLPRDLALTGLDCRPLYVEGADVEAARAGPFLIRVSSYQDAERLVGLIGNRPTGVFWSSPAGMNALYRHLRQLNVVRIALVDAPNKESDYMPVLFRHADANVIAALVTVMTADQKRTLLGGSPAIVYSTGHLGGVRALRAGS